MSLAEPFEHADWIFELKHDGFRALLYLRDGKAELVSRRGNVYKSFGPLCEELVETILVRDAIFDGELVVLDEHGRSQFNPLLRRQKMPVFYCLDLLWLNGTDRRSLPLPNRRPLLSHFVSSATGCMRRQRP